MMNKPFIHTGLYSQRKAKRQMLKSSTRFLAKTIIFIGVFATLLLLALPAGTNSAPPPSEVWFTFDYETSQRVKLEGVQLVGCDTIDCFQPVLLQQYGVCNDVACLSSSPKLTDWSDTFECAGNRCRSASHKYEMTHFKLVVQFSDQVRLSKVLDGLPTEYWGRQIVWRVTVKDAGLLVVPDTNLEQPVDRLGLFLVGLLSTQLIELIIAASYLWLWMRVDVKRLVNILLIVFLVHLVTFPMVWFFFPSLGQFQPGYARTIGVFSLIVTILYATLLAFIYIVKHRNRRLGLIGLSLISLPMTFFCFFILLFLSAYGNYSVLAKGLSPGVILLTSEIFAVVGEAVLITILSKGTLSWRQAGVMSLLANTTSFVWGLLIFGI
jgi:hypothetical protein